MHFAGFNLSCYQRQQRGDCAFVTVCMCVCLSVCLSVNKIAQRSKSWTDLYHIFSVDRFWRPRINRSYFEHQGKGTPPWSNFGPLCAHDLATELGTITRLQDGVFSRGWLPRSRRGEFCRNCLAFVEGMHSNELLPILTESVACFPVVVYIGLRSWNISDRKEINPAVSRSDLWKTKVTRHDFVRYRHKIQHVELWFSIFT